MEIQTLENGIIEFLPQIPFVVDQVGSAINWAKEVLNEGEFYQTLKKTVDVAKYTSKISEPNYYKTHLVVASILSSIPGAKDDERFKIFDTPSKAVEMALTSIVVDEKLILDKGCFKSLALTVVPLVDVDQDYLAVALFGILNDLKNIVAGMAEADVNTPITQKDYITFLGYSYVVSCLFDSKLNIYSRVSDILNEISIILNKVKF